MAIPNTTPTPNELYNGEMKKMNDTELRVVLVVTRQTLGWMKDDESGMRKKEDWISRSQLIEKTGRSDRAVSSAIDNCIEEGWIEARDEQGNLLDTPEKRNGLGRGNKIYYRLGHIFLKKTTEYKRGNACDPSGEKVKDFQEKGADSSSEKVQKVHTTKETYTKENNTKDGSSDRSSKKYPKKDYDKVTEAYKRIKGAEPKGSEWKPIQQEIKTMFMNERTPEQIISFMKDLEASDKEWTKSWTIHTVRKKMHEYLADNLGLKGRNQNNWKTKP